MIKQLKQKKESRISKPKHVKEHKVIQLNCSEKFCIFFAHSWLSEEYYSEIMVFAK